MLTEKAAFPPAAAAAQHASFFRQSGWLMIANISGGALMWMVHFLSKSKSVSAAEYGVFGTLLAVAMCVPTIPLQMVMAQQSARALATHRERELAGTIRLLWIGTFLVAAALAVVVFIFQQTILERWGITNPAALWVTVAVVLLSLWMPLFWGLLQGQQNFLWLGWTMMLNGVGRIGVAVVAVLALRCASTGMMVGVLTGLVVATVIGLWQTRVLWLAAPLPFDWRNLLGQIVPLMLGFCAFQFLFTADTMFVKAYFSGDETGFYVCAGTLSRALMWLVGPLATVMFPRIVHSAAKAEKNNLMGLVLLGTAILAVAGVVGLVVLGPFIVRFVAKPSYVQVATAVLPWYAGAMVPLALANVLLNNLLARSFFKIVPALCVLAAAYAFALTRFHSSLIAVLQTLGVFNLLLLALCAWFTWTSPASSKAN